MKYIFICSLLINMYISAMNESDIPSAIHVMTSDDYIIAIDKTIAQESNLIKTLRKHTIILNKKRIKCSGSQRHPIPIPVTYKELMSFYRYITQPASYLLTYLTNTEYSALMSITEKLKALSFYAELMQHIFPIYDLCNSFGQAYLDKALLKQIVYKLWYTKKCIKKSEYHYSDDCSLTFSGDGNFFIEDIKTQSKKSQINIWDTSDFSLARTTHKFDNLSFSPTKDYCCIYNSNKYPCCVIPHFYSFKDERKYKLQINGGLIAYSLNISSDGKYILVKEDKYSLSHTLYHFDQKKQKCTPIKLPDFINNAFIIKFHPDSQHLIYISAEESGLYSLHNSDAAQIIENQFPNVRQNITTNDTGTIIIFNQESLCSFQEDLTWQRQLPEPYHTLVFLSQKKLLFYQTIYNNFAIANEEGQRLWTILSSRKANQMIIDPTETYLATTTARNNWTKCLATLSLWNLSQLPQKMDIIHIQFYDLYDIYNTQFTNNNLILVQSRITHLFDMEGDRVLDLGPCQKFAINPKTNSIITVFNASYTIHKNEDEKHNVLRPTKMYLHTVNADKARKMINEIIPSLTLSQVLLFNEHDKRKKIKELYPNLPSGRALQSLPKEQKFLTKNFTLKDKAYNPPGLKLISQ